MFAGLAPDAIRHIMGLAHQRLVAGKADLYPGQLTADLVTRHAVLERFVCWSVAPRRGVRLHQSGGKFNNAVHLSVGVPNVKDFNGASINNKNIKPVGHKLSLCLKLGWLYTEMKVRGVETSHLCHSTLGCWRPSHLAPETHQDNVARNSGLGCAGWSWFEETQELVCYCSHNPRCEFVRIMPSRQGFGDSPVPPLDSSLTAPGGDESNAGTLRS